MTEPLFFAPVFQERIWGGTRLVSFGYEIPSSQTGECWAFSAHPHGQSVVKNGKYKGLSLGELWEEHRDLFGNAEGERFPLLTKILDANQDLSVQVHPNDEYASIHENGELGKTECWYVIDAVEDAEIIYGHHAKTKEELIAMIENQEWNKLLHRKKVKPGDFFYVPSGTVHAIGKGILILETQQNSDTTYRLYDYDRRDTEGNLREIHLEKSIEVTETPFTQNQLSIMHQKVENLSITHFVQGDYFSVEKWELNGLAHLKQQKQFLLVSIIDGEGELIKENKRYFFKKGDHFILPTSFGEYELVGDTKCIVSSL
ncbi:mannose-6-phosphate isomerase, class I [Priestia filamentosa]|uniref:mannose-6-phosphate isomerase, class I n=1 Tax=Priestia filamentosa TaxID=1402861 RepID=UPI000A0827E0|nr:mannose-6-phosphate isomerase, class I [Priestia filamentosa]MDT3762122.1 mannose-6-phosphate isomerase, class I [Priestia filamentosa]OXS65897.1 mannose-6-phosphate isomerase, class I [Priestia filamentosa]WRU96616.1 mannose-6-phosphate isomerase, class I [Priestia filamentosa]SMF62750.1 mannose-6-phosphate isomerase, type 1 [Priestia filamentosa]